MSGNRDILLALLPFTDLTKNNILESAHAQEVAAGGDQGGIADCLVEIGKQRLHEWEEKHKQEEAAKEAAKQAPASPSEYHHEENIQALIAASPAFTISRDIEQKAEAFKEQGNAAFKNKAYLEAAALYTKALEVHPYNPVYYSNRSACYLSMNEKQLALKDAEICRRLKPDWPKGCYRLAAARLALGLYEDAAVAAFEGCKLDENNHELKSILKQAVKLGQEENKKKQAAAAAGGR